jgi:3-oxoacyl-[acyl-carrier protein] reductase
MNQIDLRGRTAIVTGAAQGIGRAISERFLDSGAAVSLWDMDSERLKLTSKELSAKGKVQHTVVDVTDFTGVEEAVKAAREEFGHVDILIPNAGIAGSSVELWEYPIDEWQKVIDIDLTGVFYCCRAVVPVMIQQNYGRIDACYRSNPYPRAALRRTY